MTARQSAATKDVLVGGIIVIRFVAVSLVWCMELRIVGLGRRDEVKIVHGNRVYDMLKTEASTIGRKPALVLCVQASSSSCTSPELAVEITKGLGVGFVL